MTTSPTTPANDRELRALEPRPTTPLAQEAVRRALATRESAYTGEVQRLLDAGLELMRENGAPRVTDIVRRAGLSNATFYRHFPSKDDLLATIVEAGVYRLIDYTTHQMAKQSAPEGQLAAWVTCVIGQSSNERVADETRAALAAFGALRHVPGRQLGMAPPRALELLLREPISALGSIDPDRDAATMSRTVFGRLADFLWDRPPTSEDIDHLVRFCLAAVRPTADDR